MRPQAAQVKNAPASASKHLAELVVVLRTADGDAQVVHQPVAEPVAPAVHAQALAARPGVLHEDVGGDVLHLVDDVEFAQAVEAVLAFQRLQLLAVDVVGVADRVQPVVHQVKNVASDIFVQDAWARGQSLCVHGWVYRLGTGLVNDLGVTVGGPQDYDDLCKSLLA